MSLTIFLVAENVLALSLINFGVPRLPSNSFNVSMNSGALKSGVSFK